MKALADLLFGNKEFPIPSIPEGTRLYCIGDIHGRHDLLIQISERIQQDLDSFHGRSIIVYLGDFIDRGSNTKEVVETLIKSSREGIEYVYLRGNHEQSLLDFLQDASVGKSWLTFGGSATLASYGVHFPKLPTRPEELLFIQRELRKQIPLSHLEFFNKTTYCYEIGSYFFAHAGIRPGYPLSRQRPEDILWIREEFLSSKKRFEKVVVHGHTIVNEPEILSNRIGIDTGAYATGILTCLILEGNQQRLMQTGADGICIRSSIESRKEVEGCA